MYIDVSCHWCIVSINVLWHHVVMFQDLNGRDSLLKALAVLKPIALQGPDRKQTTDNIAQTDNITTSAPIDKTQDSSPPFTYLSGTRSYPQAVATPPQLPAFVIYPHSEICEKLKEKLAEDFPL
ncbi:hypothetical protein X975_23939, partial [Stegodyphus mimosarum]